MDDKLPIFSSLDQIIVGMDYFSCTGISAIGKLDGQTTLTLLYSQHVLGHSHYGFKPKRDLIPKSNMGG
jgi:hypothetical protein